MINYGKYILADSQDEFTSMWQIDLDTANHLDMIHHIGKQSTAKIVAFAPARLFTTTL